ncbi:MAG: hypothetical protein ACJ77M_19630 [Thermoleophilaceae bacterium]
MSANGTQKRREVSPLTLVIAATASAAAAIVTSYFWKGGSIVAAALTPVIVALVKEALQRPIESDVVRRPVQRIAESRTRTPTGAAAPGPSREPAYSGARSRFEEPPPHEPRSTRRFGGEPAPQMSQVRTYGRSSRVRRWHLKAAIVTGLVAFAIAAIVLTVPELLFGGSVSGHGSTTFFSTHKSKSSSAKTNDQQQSTGTNTDTNQTTTPPAQSQQGTQTSTQPQQQTAPSQTPPGGTPAPQQSPSPATPPAQPAP